jgi:hypothetical protein
MKTQLCGLLSLLVFCTVAGCKTEEGAPCYKDEMCQQGLVCYQRYCRPSQQVKEDRERPKYLKSAVTGYRLLISRCLVLFESYEEVDKWTDEIARSIQQEMALEPGEEAVVEASMNQLMSGELNTLSASTDAAYFDAMKVGVPLRDENPVFRKAVRSALLKLGEAGMPGPSSSVEIDFCDPDLLQLVWERLGEPAIEGITN